MATASVYIYIYIYWHWAQIPYAFIWLWAHLGIPRPLTEELRFLVHEMGCIHMCMCCICLRVRSHLVHACCRMPAAMASMEKHVQAFVAACLSQGAVFEKLCESEEQHQIFAVDQPLLKNVVKEIYKTWGHLKVPTTAQCRKLLKEANSHFLGRLTGSCSRTQSHAADAVLLHNAWAHEIKLEKQKERRHKKKHHLPASGSTKNKRQETEPPVQSRVQAEIFDVRLASALNGAGSSDCPPASKEEVIEQVALLADIQGTSRGPDSHDPHSESYSHYSDSYSYSESDTAGSGHDSESDRDDSYSESYTHDSDSYSYSESDTAVSSDTILQMGQTDRDILNVALAIQPCDVSTQLGAGEDIDDSSDDTPKKVEKPMKMKKVKQGDVSTQLGAGDDTPKKVQKPIKMKKAKQGDVSTQLGAGDDVQKPMKVKKVKQAKRLTPFHKFMGEKLKSAEFHPELDRKARFKAAAQEWSKLPKASPGSDGFGCSRCHYYYKGCKWCNPAKANGFGCARCRYQFSGCQSCNPAKAKKG